METITDKLAQEYIDIVSRYYPTLKQLLDSCYVKVVDCYLERLGKRCYYLVVYCPSKQVKKVYQYYQELKDVAENMGLIQVVILDVVRIIRDPLSTLKETNPHLWLEIYWVATKNYFRYRDI